MQSGPKISSGRLGVFVRGKSDSNAHYNAPTDRAPHLEPEQRSATPKAEAYVPSRQELADLARLPIPGAVRKLAGNTHENGQLNRARNFESSAQRDHASPTKQFAVTQLQETEQRHEIFSGSQLGENFMNSGVSTPVTEPEELAISLSPEIKIEEKRQERYIQSVPTRHIPVDRPAAMVASQKHAFSVAADGRLSVVPGVHRYHPAHMKDGFYNNDVQYGPKFTGQQHANYNFPTETLQGPAKLPMRGVRISRGQLPESSTLPLQEVGQSKERFVQLGDRKWEGKIEEPKMNESILVNDSDDDFDDFGGRYQGVQTTPKAKTQKALQNVTLRETATLSQFGRKIPPKERKRRRPSLDYDDKILSSMTFEDLQQEPFDVVPQIPGLNGHEPKASKLPTKLEQFQQQGERDQRQFFTNMSIDDWEQSGDWFVDQFSDIMNRLRDARRGKRQIIQSFETEASHREEAIRSRTVAIDKKLNKMKQDGQRVVGDKTL